MRNPQWDEKPDEALLEASRLGDAEPFAVLWERHSRAGFVAARNLAPGLEADDLVADAYLKIFELVRDGRGPRGAFRPYLYQTIKTVAADRLRSPERTTADLDDIPELHETGPWEDGAFDLAATARAFSALEPRWQAVLWYTEVEGLPPREAARLLGVSPNGVSALARRAREGLRSAWVEAHVNRELAANECRTTLEHLQRFQRGKLTARVSREVAAHLADCASCSAAAAEFSTLNRNLSLVLASLFVGGGSAALLGALGAAGAGAGASTPVAAVLPLRQGIRATGSSSAGGGGATAAGGIGVGAGIAGTLGVVGLSAAAAAVAIGIGIGVSVFNAVGHLPAPVAAADTASESRAAGERLGSEDRDASRERDSDEQRARDDDEEESRAESTGRVLPAEAAPFAPDGGFTVGPTVPLAPETPVGPVKPVDPVGPVDGSDPSLLPGYYCYIPESGPGQGLNGWANDYGVLLLRATGPDGSPVDLVDPDYDPALEGAPGNVFSGGTFTDPHGGTYDFGFYTGTDPAPYFGWWGTDPEALPAWQAAFPGLGVSDVALEIRLVTSDGRYSPWTAIDPSITCW